MTTGEEWETIRQQLADLGLSATGRLHATGLATHQQRVEQGQTSLHTLARYAADLRILSTTLQEAGTAAFPLDFWDVRSEAMQAASLDEYALVHTLSQPKYQAYLALLGRCYNYLAEFKRDAQPTAVAVALKLLRESTAYVRSGHPQDMTATRPRLHPEQQAIFLWQQLVTGTNRQIPYVHRDAYTHAYWGRCNVVEIWRYAIDAEPSVDAVWGLTGFDEHFIRDATNTNQIEHLTISALSQVVLRIPPFLLNVLEDVEWIMRQGTYQASQADKAVNRVVARFCSLFTLEDPQPACTYLEQTLARSP